MAKAGKKDARRQARLERKVQEAERHRRARRTRSVALIAGAVVVALGVAWVTWNTIRPRPIASEPAQPGQPAPPSPRVVEVADQGRAHVRPGEPHPAYNSNPPASGWHYPSTSAWGFHTEVLPDELVIHNLEHGGIWITYKDATDTEVVDALVALAREFPRKVIITHRPANDSRIAVVAWDHVMKLDHFERPAIVDFINRFKNKGPEFVPD